ncbi:bifunctional hydroxymethylpyrimidine kinase/phosphomethylpyrimidine kinase [Natranaeroarchaeum aerophilus]|uniref:Bifunctional hydroxymethylpyrimidine kinase/phosphomethylpyrimidine kinase n=1 Tax=Natranaeroarchaeum aerophilus TaxID=2917711 RepID=A0AAE3FRE7_9EURY|nr:bifunctional hydroxymethylpyrimidine kinase/phosphomethylpyrimidine kinase [Natranaeroarchaeum aerophilus]MCL9814217.1 bifunctional hydroxymethylpyrimidine kinase/phosphomethylpyrimidine kinase [Natranaeroarchaeum aerophilus]
MKPPAPERRPVTVTIAGSDSGGGAGIQADLKTMEATGAFATSVITAVTAQNTTGLTSSQILPLDEIDAQCDAVFDDFEVAAIKTGMLASADVIELVTDRVATASAPAVVDPVMVATSGDRLLDADAEDAYETLIGESTLVTPNADEAEVLLGESIETTADARSAGQTLVGMGAEAALVKGGHLHEDEATVVDVLVTGTDIEEFEHPRIDTDATHGSGCTLSSAVAARLANGDSVLDAVEWGTEFMHSAVRYHHDVGQGAGAVHHLVDLRNRADQRQLDQRLETLAKRVRKIGGGGSQVHLAAASRYAESRADVVTDTVAFDGAARSSNTADERVVQRLLGVRDAIPTVRFAVSVTLDTDPDHLPSTRHTYSADAPIRSACRDSAAGATEDPIVLEERGETRVYSVCGSTVDAVAEEIGELEREEQ